MLQQIFHIPWRFASVKATSLLPTVYTREYIRGVFPCGCSDVQYSWFRHPSYTGFFYWALGTQLVLQNPVTFVFFAILLWRFFYYRIRGLLILSVTVFFALLTFCQQRKRRV